MIGICKKYILQNFDLKLPSKFVRIHCMSVQEKLCKICIMAVKMLLFLTPLSLVNLELLLPLKLWGNPCCGKQPFAYCASKAFLLKSEKIQAFDKDL